MNVGWFLGILVALLGLMAISLAWRIRRYWRTRQHGDPIDLTVVTATVDDPGPRNTVWMKTVLTATLPNGRERRILASVRVHPERIEDFQPGFTLKGRVDPRDGELDNYDYIQLDVDHLTQRPGG